MAITEGAGNYRQSLSAAHLTTTLRNPRVYFMSSKNPVFAVSGCFMPDTIPVDDYRTFRVFAKESVTFTWPLW
jgi:hypothetical protein